jgi:hypothetical protein
LLARVASAAAEPLLAKVIGITIIIIVTYTIKSVAYSTKIS